VLWVDPNLYPWEASVTTSPRLPPFRAPGRGASGGTGRSKSGKSHIQDSVPCPNLLSADRPALIGGPKAYPWEASVDTPRLPPFKQDCVR
jgi:hypothetical protein